MAGKVYRIDLRQVLGDLSTGNGPGVLDVATNNRAEMVETLKTWLDALLDEGTVEDVTEEYVDYAYDERGGLITAGRRLISATGRNRATKAKQPRERLSRKTDLNTYY